MKLISPIPVLRLLMISSYCLYYFGISALSLSFGEEVKILSGSEEDHILRGDEFFGKELYERALESYKKALERKPDIGPEDVSLLYKIGDCHRLLGQYKEALEMAEKALIIKPSYWSAHALLGEIYQDMKEYKKAIEKYEIVINNPDASKPARLALQERVDQMKLLLND